MGKKMHIDKHMRCFMLTQCKQAECYEYLSSPLMQEVVGAYALGQPSGHSKKLCFVKQIHVFRYIFYADYLHNFLEEFHTQKKYKKFNKQEEPTHDISPDYHVYYRMIL